MKLNWAWGISFFMVAFMTFILYFVYKSTQVNIDLEYEDYYAKEMKYNQILEWSKNVTLDHLNVIYQVKQEGVNINIEGQTDSLKGDITFLCLQNAQYDVKTKISGTIPYHLPRQVFKKQGNYKVILEWSSHGKRYYQEQMLFIG